MKSQRKFVTALVLCYLFVFTCAGFVFAQDSPARPAPAATEPAPAPKNPSAPEPNATETAPGEKRAGGGAPAPLASTAIPESKTLEETCASVRVGMPQTLDILGKPGQENLRKSIVTYLSERIQVTDGNKDYGLSCSMIVYCLRNNENVLDKPGGKRPSLSAIEPLVIYTLRNKFQDCLIEGTDGLDILMKYTSMVYTWIVSLVGAVCVLIIIVSGIQVTMGGLSQEEVSQAKDRIGRSLVGLVVLFLSAFILYTINPIFYQ